MVNKRSDYNNSILREIFASNIPKNERSVVTFQDLVDDPDYVRKATINENTRDYQGTEVKEFLGITLEESRDLPRERAATENMFLSTLKSTYDYIFGGREISEYTQVVRVATVREPYMPDIDRDSANSENLKQTIIGLHPEALIDETVLDGSAKIPAKTPVYISYIDNNKQKLAIVRVAGKIMTNPSITPSTTPETTSESETTGPTNPETPIAPITEGLLYPLGTVESIYSGGFLSRRSDHLHAGIDLSVAKGTKILAAYDGTVFKVNTDPSRSTGYAVWIKHEDTRNSGMVYYTVYMHMDKTPPVTLNQEVKTGDIIGEVGSTGRSDGNHLHFEVRMGQANGEKKNPLEWIENLTKLKPTSSTQAQFDREKERRGGDLTKLPNPPTQ